MSCRPWGAGQVDPHPGAGVRWFRVDDVDRRRRAGRSPSGRSPGPGRCRHRPGDAASVPNRSKTRSRSATGMPGPSSATSSRQPVAVVAAVTADDAAGGTVPRGVVEQVRDQLVQPRRVGRARRPGGATCTSYVTSRPTRPGLGDGALQQLEHRHLGGLDSGTSPASTRARSSRSAASAASRSAWSSAVRRVPGSGSATPSTRFSSTAQSAASGVRSSWLTLATSSRRWRSTAARSSAIRLKARASSPTSSAEVALTRPV